MKSWKSVGENSCSEPHMHTLSLQSLAGQICPFFLVFERNAPSHGNGDSRLTCRNYLKKYPHRLACVSYHERAQKQFNSIDADIKRTQREYNGKSPRELHIPEGKQVCVRRPPPRSRPKGSATRFIRPFNGPYTVTGHVHGRQDLLRLRHREIHLG